MNNSNSYNKNSISLLDLVLCLVRGKITLIKVAVAVAIITSIYTLIVPKYWTSTALILPANNSSTSMSINAGFLGALGSNLLGSDRADLAVNYIAVMESRSFKENVVKRFGLVRYFKISSPDSLIAKEVAIKKLTKKVIRMDYSKETNIINISAQTKSKVLSKNIVDYYITSLEKYNKENKQFKSRLTRQFLGTRVSEIKTQIDSLSLALKEFQTNNKIIEPDKQATAIIDMYSAALTNKVQVDLEYELAKKNYNESAPILINLKEKKDIIASQIKKLESNRSQNIASYLPGISELPEISQKYMTIVMDLEIQKKVLETIYPQYELARIDEIRDMPSFEVIDQPTLAGLRAKPKRALTVVVVTLAAVLFTALLIVINSFASPEQKQTINSILRELFVFRKFNQG